MTGSTLGFLINPNIVFYYDCTSLHSYQQCIHLSFFYTLKSIAFWLLDVCHSNWDEENLIVVFYLHFADVWWFWTFFFMYLLAIWISCLENFLLCSVLIFLNHVVCFVVEVLIYFGYHLFITLHLQSLQICSPSNFVEYVLCCAEAS